MLVLNRMCIKCILFVCYSVHNTYIELIHGELVVARIRSINKTINTYKLLPYKKKS